MNREYFNYLKSISGINDFSDTTYDFVALSLWETEYYSIIDRDDNRASDGLLLRRQWLMDNNLDEDYGPCRMFEFLIGVAKRMEYAVPNYGEEYTISKFFVDMFHNLGLEKYHDEYYIVNNSEREVYDILNRVLGRFIEKNGRKGLFPLKHTTNDQRKIEFFYQMSEYLNENF